MTDLSKSQPLPVRVETSIGALSLCPLRFEDIGVFSRLPQDERSLTRLRLYLPYIAARSDALIADGERPRIDEQSVEQLSDEDMERVAEAYLSMPEMRYVTDGAGLSSGPIVRAPSESAAEYLDRVLRASHERQAEDASGTFESLHNRSGPALSSALADVDRQALSLRDVAASVMHKQGLLAQEVRPELGRNAIPSSLEGDRPLLSSADEASADDRPQPPRDEQMALTRSIGIVTTQSAILVANLSETATRYLRHLSEAIENTEEAARASLRSMLVTVLAVGAFALVAAAAAIVGYLEQRENSQITSRWQESMLRSMKETAAAQEAQIKSLNDKIGELSGRQSALASRLAAEAAAQKAGGEAEAPIQQPPKPVSPKRLSKRKTSR